MFSYFLFIVVSCHKMSLRSLTWRMAPTMKSVINWATSTPHSEAIAFHSINTTGTSLV